MSHRKPNLVQYVLKSIIRNYGRSRRLMIEPNKTMRGGQDYDCRRLQMTAKGESHPRAVYECGNKSRASEANPVPASQPRI